MVYYIFNALVYSVTMLFFTLITVVDYLTKEYFTSTTVLQCRLCYNGKVDIDYSGVHCIL